MPENPSLLHVVGRTADGRILHTMRSPTGWTAFTNVLQAAGLAGLSGQAVDVSCVRMPPGGAFADGLYVLVAFGDGPPRLLRRAPDPVGTFQQMPVPPFPVARRVAVTFARSVASGAGMTSSFLHTAVVTDDGHLLVAMQDAPGSAAVVPFDVEGAAGDRGELRAAALRPAEALDVAGPLDVELVAVGADGRIFHTSGHESTWSFLADLDTTAGPGARPGDVLDAGIALSALVANYVIVVGDGQAWLARLALDTGTWTLRWRDLEVSSATFTGGPGVGGTFDAVFDVGTFNRITTGSTTEGLHVLGTTTDGRLWHQLRVGTQPIFRDVERFGVGQVVGPFTAVACG